MFCFNTVFRSELAPVVQIPASRLATELAEAAVRRVGGKLQVLATVAMGEYRVGDAETCAIGLALDASKSMGKNYGAITRPHPVSTFYRTIPSRRARMDFAQTRSQTND